MELTPFAWLLVIVALILGFLAGYFKFKPQVPPLLYGGKRFKVWKEGEDKPKIPATGGTVNFEDAFGELFVVQVPQQIRPREITFTSLPPRPLSDLLRPPRGITVYRNLIRLTATDADGNEVDHFDPYMTTIAKYIPGDLAKVDGNVNRLVRVRHDGEAWRLLPMPVKSRNTKQRTLTAYVGSFSDCGIGGGH